MPKAAKQLFNKWKIDTALCLCPSRNAWKLIERKFFLQKHYE